MDRWRRSGGGRWLRWDPFRGRRNDRLHFTTFFDLLEAIQQWSDGQFVTGLQAGLIDHLSIDPDLIPTSQVPDQDAVIRHRQATMTPGDLGLVDTNVALEVSTDHQNGAVNRDDRGGSLDQGGESE